MINIKNLLANDFIKNIGWNVGAGVLVKIFGPVFSILIARLLTPDDYGLYAIAMTLVAFMNLLKDLGISQAIIVDHGEEDFFSFHFTLQIVMAVPLYILLYFFTPFLSDYFSISAVQDIFYWMGTLLFIYAFQDPLTTHFLKENQYKILFYRQIIPVLVYGVSAFMLAYHGFGVYSLVWGMLISELVTTVVLYYKSKLTPRFYFNLELFKRLFLLGKHLIVQKFSGFLSLRADALIVGKNLGMFELGLYKMANQITNLLPNSMMSQAQQVVFTDIAKHKNNPQYLYRRYNQFSYGSYLITLIYSVLIILLAPILIPLLLGDKWISIVPLIQLLSLALPTGYYVVLNNELAKILGFAHVYSYYSLFRSFFTVGMVFVGSLYSLEIVVKLWIISVLVSNFINQILFYNFQKIIKFSFLKLSGFLTVWIYAGIMIMSIKI